MTREMPWFKFYPADWRADQALKLCSLAARGLCVECLCLMHEAEPYGHLLVNGKPSTAEQLSRIIGAPKDEIATLLDELLSMGVFSLTRKGVVYSRRMVRDEKKARQARENGKRGGNPNLRKERENLPPDNRGLNGSVKPQKPETRCQNPDARNSELALSCLNEVIALLSEIGGESRSKFENTRNTDVVRSWIEDGCDPELDILPTIRTIMERGSVRPTSLAYFARAVLEARDSRQTAGDALWSSQDEEKIAHIARLKAYVNNGGGAWLDRWGPEPGSLDAAREEIAKWEAKRQKPS